MRLSIQQLKPWIRIGIVISCWVGIAFQLFLTPNVSLLGWNVFKAFTVQSNIWISTWLLIFMIKEYQHQPIPSWMYRVKFMFTSAILLTYSVFAILLSPLMTLSYLVSPTNILLHVTTPILAVVDFLLFDRAENYRPLDYYYGLILPLLYVIVFVVAYEMTGVLPVPYFFLNYRLIGWMTIGGTQVLGSFWWILMLTLFLIGIGKGMLRWHHHHYSEPQRTYFTLRIAGFMMGITLLTIVIHLFY